MTDIKLKVTFMPMNVVHEIDANETVLHLAQRHDIHIQSVCKGLPSCAECRVCVKEGEHHVPPPSSKELSLIGTAHYIDRSRLSCQLRCYGDITVDLTEQLEKATRAAKQPQGRHNRKEGEVSHAIKGNLIEEYTEDNDKLLAEVVNTGDRPGHDSFYEEPKKKENPNQRGNRNRNNRGDRNNPNSNPNNSGGGGQNRSAGGGGNNNRNNNRNNSGGQNRNASGGGGNPNQRQGNPRGGNEGGNRNSGSNQNNRQRNLNQRPIDDHRGGKIGAPQGNAPTAGTHQPAPPITPSPAPSVNPNKNG